MQVSYNMEDPIIPLSVKAMMGRFEQFSTNESQNSQVFRQVSKKKSNIESSSPSLIQQTINVNKEVPKHSYNNRKGLERPENRIYSISQNQSIANDEADLKDRFKKLTHYENVNPLLSKEKQNKTDSKTMVSEKSQIANKDFSSFVEKQKLVESIVLNIKNNGSKSRSETPKRSPSPPVTSKMEKDLRNTFEKGIRKLSIRRSEEKLNNPLISSNHGQEKQKELASFNHPQLLNTSSSTVQRPLQNSGRRSLARPVSYSDNFVNRNAIVF